MKKLLLVSDFDPRLITNHLQTISFLKNNFEIENIFVKDFPHINWQDVKGDYLVICISYNYNQKSLNELKNYLLQLQFKQTLIVLMPGAPRSEQVILTEKSEIIVIEWNQFLNRADGISVFDSRVYYLCGCPFSFDFLKETANLIETSLKTLLRQNFKVIITDLDDTLWKGTLAESPSPTTGQPYAEKSFLDIQKILLKCKRNGILLVLATKNNPDDVSSFLRRDDFLIKEQDFTLVLASWEKKPVSINSALKNLNILPEHILYLDNSPHERELMKTYFPNIEVLSLPENVLLWPKILESKFIFELNQMTGVDQNRTELYASLNKRNQLKTTFPNFEDWLKDLKGTLKFESINPQNQNRALQLIDRTNQFNLFPHRYSLNELQNLEREGIQTKLIRYQDRIADDGYICFLAYKIESNQLYILDFILSCRVFGRFIEIEILSYLIKSLQQKTKIGSVFIQYKETPRGQAGADFIKGIASNLTRKDLMIQIDLNKLSRNNYYQFS